MAYEVTIGEHYDQDQIEAIFNTGFGYQITGINVRRDNADQRYIPFSKEDGHTMTTYAKASSSTSVKADQAIKALHRRGTAH